MPLRFLQLLTIAATLTVATAAPPAVSGLIPNSATAGGPAFTLTINGTGFLNPAIVVFGGTAVTTTYVSATQLTAVVPASLITAAGSFQVIVSVNGALSTPVTITILPSSAPMPPAVTAPVITTVVGTDFSFPSQPLPALNAPLGQVAGVAVDAQGNIYAADPDNNLVARISPDGILTIVAGNGIRGYSGDGGPAGSASLSGPRSVGLDAAGNLYIVDNGNNRIREVSSGIITTVAGGGSSTGDGIPATSARLSLGTGIAVDPASDVFIVSNSTVREVSGGIITTVAGGGSSSSDGIPATAAQISPYGNITNGNVLGLDAAGDLFILSLSGGVRKVSGGIITTVAGTASISFASVLAVDPAGDIYIGACCIDSTTVKVSGGISTPVVGGQALGFSGDGGPALGASVNNPQGLAVDVAGNLFIADSWNSCVREVNAQTGIISTLAGNGSFQFSGDGGLATSAALHSPGAVAVDARGNLYIADSGNLRVRGVSGRIIATAAGNGLLAGSDVFAGYELLVTSLPAPGPAAAPLFLLAGLAVDSTGTLYIADSKTVKKVQNGVLSYVSNLLNGFLFNADGVAVDLAGAVYVADGEDSKIVKISGGTNSFFAGDSSQPINSVRKPGFSGDGGPRTWRR